jgi:hypothetical protein
MLLFAGTSELSSNFGSFSNNVHRLISIKIISYSPPDLKVGSKWNTQRELWDRLVGILLLEDSEDDAELTILYYAVGAQCGRSGSRH